MGRDLVVFGEDWGRHPSSTQHLVRQLAADRRVLWVNSIGLRRPRLSATDVRRATQKLLATLGLAARAAWRSEPEPPPPGMTVLSPLAVSWPGSRLAAGVNRVVLAGQVRQAMRTLGIERPVVWASLPSAVQLLGTLGERGVVYYCGDDFSSLAGVDHGPVSRQEAELVRRADHVFAVTPVLAARFPPAKTTLLPHGVELERFAAPTVRPADLPPSPVAGFYGSIDDRLDQALLAHVADCLPHWTFVLIGETHVSLDALQGLPNVRLLGPRRYADLPGYVQHWDVSLLPYRNTPMVQASNPLKLREYLAGGRAVVATACPAVEPYADVVCIARNASEFAAAVESSRQETDEHVLRRRVRVQPETWQARAATAAAVIDAIPGRR
jgi:glycosyltransferase involved in cell wall biosynthesis